MADFVLCFCILMQSVFICCLMYPHHPSWTSWFPALGIVVPPFPALRGYIREVSFSRAGGFIRALEVFSLIVTFQSLDVRLVGLVAGGEQVIVPDRAEY